MGNKRIFEALVKKRDRFRKIETFAAPKFAKQVTLISDEVTAVCPVTNQPDWYTVEITYKPDKVCIESKSLKLFFHSLRSKGLFCEDLADLVLTTVCKVLNPKQASVRVIQKARGGISIISVSEVEYDRK